MLRAAAIAAALTIATAAMADDRTAMVDALGAISISPQICGLELDREKLASFTDTVTPTGDTEFEVDIFRANNRFAQDSAAWSAAERTAFCTRSAELIADLGLA